MLILFGGVFSAMPALAQEDKTQSEIDYLMKDRTETPVIMESELRSDKKVARDTVLTRVTKPAATPKPQEKNQKEDPLSFNFLYYIIEKFKLSDIIE